MKIPSWLWAFIGFAVGSLITPLLTKIVLRAYDEYRDRSVRKTQARKDLKGLITLFCDVWEDRDYIKPHVKNFRQELVDQIMEIREKSRLFPVDLSPETLDQLREISNSFLEIANKEPSANDDEWCCAFSKKIDGICIRLKDLATKLS